METANLVQFFSFFFWALFTYASHFFAKYYFISSKGQTPEKVIFLTSLQVGCGSILYLILKLRKKHMAGITQEVHPYQPNVQSFSRSQFFTELHGSFYIFPIRGSVPSVAKKINKKVSGKNLNLTLKTGIFCFKIFLKSQKRQLCEAN